MTELSKNPALQAMMTLGNFCEALSGNNAAIKGTVEAMAAGYRAKKSFEETLSDMIAVVRKTPSPLMTWIMQQAAKGPEHRDLYMRHMIGLYGNDQAPLFAKLWDDLARETIR